MDLVTLITILGGIVAILGFLYLLFIGQKSLFEWWRERQEKHGVSPARATPPKPEVPTIPGNLPPRGEFIGREKEKTRVREALASRYPLTCIDGIGGIGKTALALEAASECRRASKGEIPADGIPTFDGFIWTTAKDRELTLNDVLDAIARTLDYPGIAQQPLEEKQESVRKLLQSERYLLIVDNFETVTDDAVRDFLLRLPEPSKALITSREQKLRQAWAVSLKGLEQEEALTLTRSEGRRLGLASVEKGEEKVLLRLYQATGGAPLAIKWAVGQIKQKGQSLDTVLATLHEAKGDIFEEVFARSWSLLTDDARCILMVMPIFAASASRAAIEAASDVRHYALDEGLGQLMEMWLVEATDELEADKRRYSVHPLTRAYAGAKLRREARFEGEAKARWAGWYEQLIGSAQVMRNLPALKAETSNIMALLDWYDQSDNWQELAEAIRRVGSFLFSEGFWETALRYGERVAQHAQEAGDYALFVEGVLDTLLLIYAYRGKEGQASGWIEKAETAAIQANNQLLLAKVLYKKSCLLHRQGRYSEAEEPLSKAIQIFRQADDRARLAWAFNQFGNCLLEQKRFEEARQLYQESLNIWQSMGEDIAEAAIGIAVVQGNLGIIEGRERHYHEARDLLYDVLGRLVEQTDLADVYIELAVIEYHCGNLQQAQTLANQAEHIIRQLGMKRPICPADSEWMSLQRQVAWLEGKLSADR